MRRSYHWWTAAAAALATTASVAAAQSPPIGSAGSQAAVAAATSVRLMVMKEVTTRYAKIGDRFRLRVDEAATVNGTTIPVGATAWGEVTSVSGTNVGGKSGKLTARLLYVDLPSGPLPLIGAKPTAIQTTQEYC